jgi:hypothetical protein
MHYVCIEENKVVGVMPYEPSVPVSVQVVTISDEDYNKVMDQTHYFDVVTKSILAVGAEILSQKAQEQLNAVEREFLNSTDWKVLRHQRQVKLGETTSLTEEEYLELERQRSAAAARIV